MHLLLILLLGLTGAVSGGAAPAHPLHVSYGRMAVEGKVAMCQIRFFRDDLEAALQAFHRDPTIRLSAGARIDSLYAAYFDVRFRLEAGGRVLPGVVVASGEEEDMWWYTTRFEAPAPIRALQLTHTMLFDVFADQHNLVKVRHFPGEETQTLYFARGEEVNAVTF